MIYETLENEFQVAEDGFQAGYNFECGIACPYDTPRTFQLWKSGFDAGYDKRMKELENVKYLCA